MIARRAIAPLHHPPEPLRGYRRSTTAHSGSSGHLAAISTSLAQIAAAITIRSTV